MEEKIVTLPGSKDEEIIWQEITNTGKTDPRKHAVGDFGAAC